MKQYSWSLSGMSDYILDVREVVYRRLGNYDHARSVTVALEWYIPRSRAEFCKLLVQTDPSRIAAILLKGGSIEQQIEKIKRSIGYGTQVFA